MSATDLLAIAKWEGVRFRRTQRGLVVVMPKDKWVTPFLAAALYDKGKEVLALLGSK
jgi:hypothetical protein